METIVENLVYIICENRGFKWKLNVANVLMEQKSDILLRTTFWLNSCSLKQIKTNLVLLI